MRAGALCWLALVAIAAAYLFVRVLGGIELQTDLMALLPQEERDGAVRHAKAKIADFFGRRIILLVGHVDRATARAAGSELAQTLQTSGMATSLVYQGKEDSFRELGEIFFTHRSGLITPADRARLLDGRGQEIVTRALATLYGPLGIVDATLLRSDPFLLLPAFVSELPLPLSRVSVDQGLLSISDAGKTYIVIAAQLKGDAFSLSFQAGFMTALDAAEHRLRARAPGIEILRSGALFYAHSGASIAQKETSTIGTLSMLGTLGLILLVFRRLRPLWFNMLALGVGVLCAFAASLWLFGTLHVAALLFGVSLIGVAVDYSLHYSCEGFAADAARGRERIRRALPGIVLGLATTLIGYFSLLLAPLPGLHQLALFSVVGLVASFLTVVLWLPLLDVDRPLSHGRALLAAAAHLWTFWEEKRHRWVRRTVVGAILAVAVAGASRFTIDDDVRRLQTLPSNLKQEEAEIRRLTGTGGSSQFFLVNGPDRETVLQREEALIPRLEAAKRNGWIGQFQAVAQITPSAARQRENQALVHDKLVVPFLASYYDQLGMTDQLSTRSDSADVLTPDAVGANSPLSFLRSLVIEDSSAGASNLVLLDSVARPDEVEKIAQDVPGVRYVDPTGDFSRLFGEYRRRAVMLLALSAVLMLPILLWRYGLRQSFRVLLPSAMALVLTPPLVALAGAPFTFFNAIALVLVLAIGIDYAIFCSESEVGRRSSTMLGIWLATLTTIMSFGFLALSSVYAVHAFGITLAVGISLAFFFSPLAGQKRPSRLAEKPP